MLNIFTIVYNGEPYIERHLPIFEQLKTSWRWIVVHGPANNGGSTAWCEPQQAGKSTDGTYEYLERIAWKHSQNVVVISKDLWPSKDEMIQAALNEIREPGVLLEVDSDELWVAGQLEKIVELFESDPSLGAIKFPCRYWVGPDLICVGENCWSNKADEWLRAWRFVPGMQFVSHEPPVCLHFGRTMEREEARSHDLMFDHFSYVTEAQVAFKEKYYNYPGAVEGWRRLQAHTQFPVPLRQFFSWLPDDRTMVKRFREEGDASCASTVDIQTPAKSVTDRQSNAAANVPPVVAAHSGDHGDVLAALPTIRALGGGALIITDGSDGQRESMKGARFDAIRPLLEAQPYISAVQWQDEPQGVTHDFRGFRKLKAQMQGVSLAQWQLQYLGLEGKANLEPWLTVEPDDSFHGMAVFARTLRYHNPYFPWREILSRLGNKAVFVGLQSEWEAFQKQFGHISYLHTSNLLDLAGIIAGCKLLVCNQSCPYWIAAGLGVPIVQETWSDQNSIVSRPNAIYSRTEFETSKLMEKIERLL